MDPMSVIRGYVAEERMPASIRIDSGIWRRLSEVARAAGYTNRNHLVEAILADWLAEHGRLLEAQAEKDKPARKKT